MKNFWTLALIVATMVAAASASRFLVMPLAIFLGGSMILPIPGMWTGRRLNTRVVERAISPSKARERLDDGRGSSLRVLPATLWQCWRCIESSRDTFSGLPAVAKVIMLPRYLLAK